MGAVNHLRAESHRRGHHGATTALFRFGDRWFPYRDLQSAVLRGGWVLITHFEVTPSTAWPAFVAATDAAIDKYNGVYEADLITAAKSKGEAERESGRSDS
jgi:hypothetical protein